MIANFDDTLLITGSNGFIGSRVVEVLLSYGFRNLRCFVRPTSNVGRLQKIRQTYKDATVDIRAGNLLDRESCRKAAEGAAVVYHLAAGMEKTFPGCFLNSVVTTRNLLDALIAGRDIRRFVNISSFSVYSNLKLRRGALLDETCALDDNPIARHEAYAFAKLKQELLVKQYGEKHNLPYVIMRPGAVYGPGSPELTSRIGINTFGIFLHLGGPNRVPLSFVDNCAEAIVLAGLAKGVEGEAFNVVDDDLPTSRQFLRMYKKNARAFRSIYIPYRLFYFLNYLWEKYAERSEGQLPPVFNRPRCATYWKGNRYSNDKMKRLLGWKPRVSFEEAAKRYFDSIKESGRGHA